MKNFIIWVMCIILACVVGCNTAKAQSVKRDGNTFITVSDSGVNTSKDVSTSYTWKDKEGNEYPIFLHKFTKGDREGQYGAYVIRKSKKTGNDYKYYLPNNEEIANTIVKEMGL